MKAQQPKTYLSAQSLLEDSFRLGAKIIKSGFRPTFIVAIWRGGVPMGIAIQEFLAFHGVQTDHIAIRTRSYSGIDRQARKVKMQGLNYLVKQLAQSDKLLIVDDVFDTGRSIESILQKLKTETRRNMPDEVKIAVPYYKPARNQLSWKPDYYLYETDAWLKYPHSLEGLSRAEIEEHRPEIFKIFKIFKDYLP